jgi:hypothetical protein
MRIRIAWIADTLVELPLTGFRVDRDDLLDAVQHWIKEMDSAAQVGTRRGSTKKLIKS